MSQTPKPDPRAGDWRVIAVAVVLPISSWVAGLDAGMLVSRPTPLLWFQAVCGAIASTGIAMALVRLLWTRRDGA